MADDAENEESQEPLTEEQRIELLEGAVSLHKKVILIIGLIAILLATIVVTGFTVLSIQYSKSPTKSFKEFAVEAKTNTKSIKKIEKRIEEISSTATEAIDTHEKRITDLDSKVVGDKSVPLIKSQIEQERDYQEFLVNMKRGMTDMARMVRGSRTWLEIYGERMDSASKASRKRETELDAILKPKPPTKKK